MWFYAIGAAGLILTTTAMAAPVYLQCPIAEAEGKSLVHLQVTVNEDNGTAGYLIDETGFSQQDFKAAFTPDAVMWARQDNAYGETRFRIERTTLVLTEVTYLQGKVWSERSGTCSLVEIKHRKF